MCIFCGGQCGGLGEFLISLGLPLLGLYVFRIKNSLVKIKNKILRRGCGAGGIQLEAINRRCGDEAAMDDRKISLQPIDPTRIELLAFESQDNEPAEFSPEKTELTNEDKVEKIELKGVRGWLLLLCLNLTIFIPASCLYEINCSLNLINSINNNMMLLIFNKLLLYNVINILTLLLLAIFSFYAGLRLWEVRQGAVKIVKVFLITQLSLILIIAVIRPFMTFPFGGNDDIFGNIIKSVIPSLFHFSLWYLYLSKSRRVHNTYNGFEEKRALASGTPGPDGWSAAPG